MSFEDIVRLAEVDSEALDSSCVLQVEAMRGPRHVCASCACTPLRKTKRHVRQPRGPAGGFYFQQTTLLLLLFCCSPSLAGEQAKRMKTLHSWPRHGFVKGCVCDELRCVIVVVVVVAVERPSQHDSRASFPPSCTCRLKV